MSGPYRWDPCIAHRGQDVGEFIADYFSCACRRVLLVAGAGFDPRSLAVATLLGGTESLVHALFIQETRSDPTEAQVDRARTNKAALLAAIANHDIVPIEIFGSDGAVVGGRNVIAALSQHDVTLMTDIVADVSALSAGTSYPIIRYFVELIGRGNGPSDLHVFVAHDPRLDANIRSIPSDVPGYIHGFRGGSTLFSASSAARLWLPQLATGRRGALGRLYDFVEPRDTCPILPFPASNPRLGDSLAAEYLTELETTWSVNSRNVVYADESDPLDLYRTILRLVNLREPVFAHTGGSMLILSPLGSKVMALGALMAALERDLPVAHLEPIGYEFAETVPERVPEPNLVHVWLEGDAYPQPRRALPAERRAAP